MTEERFERIVTVLEELHKKIIEVSEKIEKTIEKD